eukprot:scaffold72755_cov92-Phaeocystis_antarctica.AAC.4
MERGTKKDSVAVQETKRAKSEGFNAGCEATSTLLAQFADVAAKRPLLAKVMYKGGMPVSSDLSKAAAIPCLYGGRSRGTRLLGDQLWRADAGS